MPPCPTNSQGPPYQLCTLWRRLDVRSLRLENAPDDTLEGVLGAASGLAGPVGGRKKLGMGAYR